MIKQKRFTLDGVEYEATQLGALEGRKIWLRLLKALAPAVKELTSANHLTMEAVGGGLAAAVENLSEEDYELMMKAFAKRCSVRIGEKWPSLSDETTFDQHFAGRYTHMSKWFGECAAFNFADFLGEASLGSLMNLAKNRVEPSRSPSPPISTGLSGAS